MSTLRWHHTLAWKFFLRTALAILFLMGVVLWVAFDQAQKGARSSAERGLRTASRVLDKQVPQEIRVLDAGLEVFVTQSTNSTYIDTAEKKGEAASVRDYLLQSLPNLKADIAVIVRPSGQLLSCTTDGRRHDYAEVAIVQMALDPEGAKGAGYPGPSYAGFLELPEGAYQGFYLTVSRPLRLPDGQVIGAMLVGRRLHDAAATDMRDMAVGRMEPPSHVAVISRGRLVGSTLGDQAATLDQLLRAGERYGPIHDHLMGGQPSDLFPVRLGSVEYLARVNPLRGSDGLRYELATALLLPLEPFMAPFRKLQWSILGTGAVGLLVALGIALRSARGVTAPLARLTQATARLAEGGRPDLPEGAPDDEVGALTSAFRALLGELKAKDDLLAALESLRSQEAPAAQAGLSVLDLDATVMMPSGSQGLTNAGPGAGPDTPGRRISLREGDVFAGRYRIDSVLGRGGMGLVLKAHDQQLGEDVAIKVIRPEHELDAAFLEQLKQEIKLARRITHRHVLRTHDFGEASGIPFVTMEYLKGVTLKQLLDDRGRLPLPLVLRIGRQVAEGLEAAHAVGVVHRDIKPLNVLFDVRGDAKLMDFGLATPVDASGVGADGHLFGTPRYMAPEQIRGAGADPRTDLYALGVMLFELSVGRPPFEGSDITELLRQHLHTAAPDAALLAPDLPVAFTRLLARLLEKDLQQRPASAAEVVDLLKEVATA